MHLHYAPYRLRFKHPFGVAGHTRAETTSVFISITHKHLVGYGEACLPAYLGEDVDKTLDFFRKATATIETLHDIPEIETFMANIDTLHPGCNAAKAAIDMALCDLAAKSHGQSYQAWQQLPQIPSMPTSFTIGIDHREKIIQKLHEAKAFHILKIKAGTENDKDLISLIREYTDKPLYVDVNQGWRDAKQALHTIEWMAEKGVVLVEQPLPKEMKKQMHWLSARSPIPTFADESVKRFSDLQQLDGAFHGINIKLMKCTGLTEALKMIRFCKANHIQVFLGCMAESSCATAAMTQLLAYADFVDLDAPQLYINDPFMGPTYADGKVWMPQGVGIGAEPNPQQSLANLLARSQ